MQRKLEEALARAEDAAAEASVLQCSAYVCSVLGLASVLAGALFHGLHEGSCPVFILARRLLQEEPEIGDFAARKA